MTEHEDYPQNESVSVPKSPVGALEMSNEGHTQQDGSSPSPPLEKPSPIPTTTITSYPADALPEEPEIRLDRLKDYAVGKNVTFPRYLVLWAFRNACGRLTRYHHDTKQMWYGDTTNITVSLEHLEVNDVLPNISLYRVEIREPESGGAAGIPQDWCDFCDLTQEIK